jgi:hypothetical protein
MSAPKTGVAYGLLAKTEATNGTYNTPSTSTDGVQLAERPTLVFGSVFDGGRPMPPGTGGTQLRAAPQGESVSTTLKIENKGAGAAYSSSVVPRDLHVLLKASGLTGTGSFTGGSEKWTYVPTAVAAAPSSASLEFYCHAMTSGNGEKVPINFVYTDPTFTVENGGIGMWEFPIKGRLNAATSEVSWPTITYAPTIIPPVAGPLVLTVNSVATLVIRKASVKFNRTLQDRYPNENVAGSHGGFHPGRRSPEFSFTMEAIAIATFDPFALWRAGTAFAASFQVGSTQYNECKWTFAQAQISKAPTIGYDGDVPTIDVTCSLHCSTANTVDDLSLVFD